MPDQPQEVSDVEVVLKAAYAERTPDAIAQLSGVGLQVAQVIEDEGVIEGTLPADKLADLRALDCVSYVRNVFTYVAGERDG